MTQPAATTELRYARDLPGLISAHSSGLVLIGSPESAGSSTLAHAAATAAANAHGGDVAIVSPNHARTLTNTPGTAFHRIPVAPSGGLADIQALQQAIRLPGVKTIVYDSTPQIGGVAYASALARAGWLVLLTLPLDDVEDLIETAVNCQTVACYQQTKGGGVLAAEDIAQALIAVTVQTLETAAHPQPDSQFWFLNVTDTERQQIVADRSHLADTVGLVKVS